MEDVVRTLLERNRGVVKRHREDTKELTSRKITAHKQQIQLANLSKTTEQCGKQDGYELYEPLDLLPEEVIKRLVNETRAVWMLIFKSRQLDIKDLTSCYQSCKLFNKLLQDTISKHYFEKILPFVYPMLDPQDILNCRRICKKWNNATDTFLAQEENQLYLQAISGDDCRGTIYLDRFTLDDVVGPYKFHLPFSASPTPAESGGHKDHNRVWEQLSTHGRNPLIGRKVEIVLKEPFDEACQDAEQLLRTFKEYIHYLLISCESFLTSSIQFYGVCVQAFDICLNLKSITISPNLRLGLDDDDEAMERFLPVMAQLHYVRRDFGGTSLRGIHFNFPIENVMVLDNIMEATFLPAFQSQLTSATLENVISVRNFPRLTRLTMNRMLYESNMETFALVDLPCLKRLDIQWQSGGGWFYKMIKAVRNFKALAYLVLTIPHPSSGDVFTLPHTWSKEYLNPANIVPPTVSTLSVQGKYSLYNFDFLLFFPCLQELAIQSLERPEVPPYSWEVEMEIDIGEILTEHRGIPTGYARLQHSSVWRDLPLLRQIHVSVPDVRKTFYRA